MKNSSPPATQVHLDVEGEVARVTFSGERGIQTLGSETRAALHSVLDDLEKLDHLRVVLFHGTGRTFIAGADIHEFLDLDDQRAKELIQNGQKMVTRIANLPAVTIAAMNGACAGGGFELALACDYRFAIKKIKIGLPETTLGILPCWGGTVRSTLMFGSAIANRLILTGELLSAKQAKKLGIVHELCAEDDWTDFLARWIDTILSRGPSAQREAKRLIQKTERTISQLELGLSDELNAFVSIVQSGELQTGARAFLDKTKPVWS